MKESGILIAKPFARPNGLAFKGPRLVEPDQIAQEVLELVERVFPGNVEF